MIFRWTIPFLVLGLLACGSERPGPERPNIVVVSVDTLNRSALRSFDSGAEEHLNLDRFANNAARFINAHSTGSWTLPAHGSLMTGLYPDRHGAVNGRRALNSSIPTLAGYLQASGYETVGFTDGGYVDPSRGFAKGFDRYDDWSAGSGDAAWDVPRGGKRSDPAGSALFDRGIHYVQQRQPKNPPFFLFLHTYSVHDYFRRHPWTVERLPKFQDRDAGEYVGCLTGRLDCSEGEWRRLAALYAAELHNLDAGFGRLLETLDGVARDTFVVLLSDHGEGFDAQRGRIHHGGRLHYDQVRVPLLVGGPGVAAQDIEMPVSLVDVMPALMELAGVEPKGSDESFSELDGRSFARQLWTTGTSLASSNARVLYALDHSFFWSDGRRLRVSETREEPYSVAVMRGEFWYWQSETVSELYRMTDDPHQTRNLAADMSVVSELRELIDARSFVTQGREHAIDKETEQRLRSLGYIR